MQQKTIWQAYLIIGISILLLTNCGRKIVDPPEPVTHFKAGYINLSDTTLSMQLFNADNVMFDSFQINENDTVMLDMQYTASVELFKFEKRKAKKVVLNFSDNKCFEYLESSSPQGELFDITKYENYSKELIQNPPFTLYFEITEEEHISADICD